MANYNKPVENKKSIGVIITTLVFALVGAICIFIGFGNEMLAWVKTFGIVVCVLVAPILIFVIYRLIKKRIEDL